VSYDDGISDEIGGLDEQGLGLRRRGLPMPPSQFRAVGTADFSGAPPNESAPPPVTRRPIEQSPYTTNALPQSPEAQAISVRSGYTASATGANCAADCRTTGTAVRSAASETSRLRG